MSTFEVYPEHLFFDNAAKVAIQLAERSALHNGQDIPVGAVALFGAALLGSGYAIDNESGLDHMHAEIAALTEAQDSQFATTAIVSTMEPCEQCQDALAEVETLETVAFVVPRTELSDRGIVMPRRSIQERTAKFELPYNVVRLDNPALTNRALEPLAYTSRDLTTGKTNVDSEAFRAHIARRTA